MHAVVSRTDAAWEVVRSGHGGLRPAYGKTVTGRPPDITLAAIRPADALATAAYAIFTMDAYTLIQP